MSNHENKTQLTEMSSEDYKKLLDEHALKAPQIGEMVKGEVIEATRSEVKLDINGMITGVVRGPELYEEDDDYANLKSGDQVEATVIDEENENGDLELSFRYAGQEKAWSGLRSAFKDNSIVSVKIVDANKGGLLAKFKQIAGFLPVSQLAPENYPRINGGDKGKILDKLRSFVGNEFEVKVMNLDEKDDKIIFSEKDAWNEKQKDVISKYKVGTQVDGSITAITDFGVFVSFGESLEGLIHISELAWQRIDNPNDLYQVGDTVKAEVISIENSKIFLSAKKLLKDPWEEVSEKYKLGQIVEGTILKVNPFGLFVKLDNDIHGLAHISQLGLAPKQKINDKFEEKSRINFEIVSIEAKEHRLGLAYSDEIAKAKAVNVEDSKKSKADDQEEAKKEKKAKAPKKKANKKEKEEKIDKKAIDKKISSKDDTKKKAKKESKKKVKK
jgi:small subunit ribosomal protein S1